MARYENEFDIPWGKIIIGIAVLVMLLTAAFSVFVIVPAGHRGVVLKFGAVEDRVLVEGLHIITPFVESARIMEVRTQKYETDAESASKDLLDVKTTLAVNYHLDPTKVNMIYQQLGEDYSNRVISPNVQEVVKAVTAKFDAQGLISQRELVKVQVEEALRERLNERGIMIETISIVNFKFPEQFNEAITAKQTADQEAQKAQNILRRIQIEADQKIAAARGEAEAIRVINEELQRSPQYVQLLAVQKWDGKLPYVTGNGMPLVNIPIQQTGGTSG